MQGHIKKRATWEYVAELGPQPLQRCPSCRKRFWIKRERLASCPLCQGPLEERVARRQEMKAGFATKREAQEALPPSWPLSPRAPTSSPHACSRVSSCGANGSRLSVPPSAPRLSSPTKATSAATSFPLSACSPCSNSPLPASTPSTLVSLRKAGEKEK